MTRPAVSRPPANKWMIAGTMVFGSFVVVMDISIVNVALPQMLGTFGVPLDAITWVAVAYSIAEMIMTTMAAWCSMLLGRKRFYLLSFAFFTGASVLCGLARSLEMMILARALQGMEGGGLIPVAQAVMLEMFPEEERGMAMALYSMGVVVAPTVGPVLGGWLTDAYGWPWIFYINVPIGIFGLFMAQAVLQDPPHLRRAFDGLTERLASSGLPPGVAEESALQLINGTVNRHATIMAYNDVFWTMGMLFVVSLPFLLLLSGRRSRATAIARKPALQRS